MSGVYSARFRFIQLCILHSGTIALQVEEKKKQHDEDNNSLSGTKTKLKMCFLPTSESTSWKIWRKNILLPVKIINLDLFVTNEA